MGLTLGERGDADDAVDAAEDILFALVVTKIWSSFDWLPGAGDPTTIGGGGMGLCFKPLPWPPEQ